MVRELSLEVRLRIVELWLDGDSYRRIPAETGASLGAISSIIDGEKKRVPGVQELRQLNVALKKADANLMDALRGARLLEKLNSLNIQVDGIRCCISLLEKYGENAGDVLD